MIKYKESESQLIEDGKERYLELVLKDAQLEEFRINMINSNAEKGFITLEKSKFNNNTNLRYCITGYESLDTYINKNMLDKEMTIKILKGISEILLKSSKALLKVENFIIEKENIFINRESLDIKLINIPLKENYNSNINQSYMDMVRDLMNYALINNKVDSNGAAFVVSIKKIVEDETLTISDFIKRIENQKTTSVKVSNSDKKNQSNLTNKTITPPVNNTYEKGQNTIIKTKEVSSIENDNYIKTPYKDIQQEPKIADINVEKQEEFEVIEKKQFKTGRIITTIIIQPIFVGIILSLLLIDGVTTVQMIGGALLLLALDGVIIKNLLDPSKKETIKVRVRTNKKVQAKENKSKIENKVENKNNKTQNLQPKQPSVPQPVVPQQKQVVKPQVIEVKSVELEIQSIEEPTNLDEVTTLDDEGTVVETIAYLDVDNGNEVRTEEIITDSYVIGRSENLKSYISSTSVSRRHIEIFRNNDEYFVRDLKSKNGTKLNGVRLSEGEERPLNIGDTIEIPDLVLTFKL